MIKNYFKPYILLLIFSLIAQLALATHYRAGEIIYRNLSGFNYEITVYTYTDQYQLGADPGTASIVLDFGDGKVETINRTAVDILLSDVAYGVKRNTYKTTHTYTGSRTFQLCVIDKNRVNNILNINDGRSVNIPFAVTSQIVIGSGFSNQSPILLSLPIDRGCVNKPFVHNPSAYDPDGDSLVYEIKPPLSACDEVVPGFQIPEYTDSFSINQITGLLTWRSPKRVGIYNIVIRVKEYRRNGSIKPILVGYVDRDMQIRISECFNNPPLISKLENECVIAGTLIQKNISATDVDVTNTIKLSAFGGPFVQKNSPAFTNPTIANGNPTGFLFNWKPSCTSIRASEFQADFKAEDNGSPIPLIDVNSFKIKVIGPAPNQLKINQDSNGLKLTWNPDTCNFAFGYRIYRKIDSSNWTPTACQTGVPISTGFDLLDTVQGVNNTKYFDNNNGAGLSPLINYCYRITSFYLARNDEGKIVQLAESSEGKSSIEICATIIRTKPIITNVSVINTDQSKGSIFVKWLKPLLIDSSVYLPPYSMQLQRSIYGSNIFNDVIVSKVYNTFNAIQNDSLIDSNINTQNNQYNYRVIFYATKNANLQYVDQSINASSVYLKPYNSNRTVVLNYKFEVPWLNKMYDIYKKIGTEFKLIGTTFNQSYSDTGLVNGETYCYYIKATGFYNPKLLADTLLNNSQEVCGTPIDTIPPCTPILSYISPCNKFNSSNIILNWKYPNSCTQDVKNYKVYYRKKIKDTWNLLATLDANNFSYTDTNSLLKYSIAGCYAVTAIDSIGNESSINGNAFCIDNCPYYVLPNVFTPNNDVNNLNEVFKPFPYRFIEKIELQIFNRWGTPVFETTDIDINWNGKDKETGNELSAGTYFYTIKIFENYLGGTTERKVRGTITIIR